MRRTRAPTSSPFTRACRWCRCCAVWRRARALRGVVALFEQVGLDAALPRRLLEALRTWVAIARAWIDQKETLQGGPTLPAAVGPRDRQVEPNGPWPLPD